MSLADRVQRLGLDGELAGFVTRLAQVDPAACTRLLDERAATPGLLLEFWVPRALAATLSPPQSALLAVPALIGAPLSRPAALRMAGRLGAAPGSVEEIVGLGLWVGGPPDGYSVHRAAAPFVTDPEALGDRRVVLQALLDADAVDELPAVALGALAGSLLAHADAAMLAEAAPRVLDALLLADRTDDALDFGHAAADHDLADPIRAGILFALGEALELADRMGEALTHYGLAAALADPASEQLARCRQAMGELHIERAEGELAGRALAEAYGAWVACGDHGAAAEVATTLGALAIVAGHASTGIDWLRDAIRLGGLAGSNERVVAAYELMAQAERSRGNPHVAADLDAQADRTRRADD
jgi:tetratricopeptide (TPR) repeat protein